MASGKTAPTRANENKHSNNGIAVCDPKRSAECSAKMSSHPEPGPFSVTLSSSSSSPSVRPQQWLRRSMMPYTTYAFLHETTCTLAIARNKSQQN